MAKKTFVDRLKQPSTWLILAFILGLVVGLAREAKAAEVTPVIGVGYGVVHNENMVVQELGLRVNGRWDFTVVRTGNSELIDDSWVYRIDRLVMWREGKDLRPFLAIGAAYWDAAPAALVSEQLTFSLQAGVRYREVVELVWQHYSTSGRAEQNDGVDYINLRAILEF